MADPISSLSPDSFSSSSNPNPTTGAHHRSTSIQFKEDRDFLARKANSVNRGISSLHNDLITDDDSIVPDTFNHNTLRKRTDSTTTTTAALPRPGSVLNVEDKQPGTVHIVRQPTGPGGRSLLEKDEDAQGGPSVFKHLTLELRRLYTKYSPSLILENKGSVARDHLANERTFLAWLRSSLSLITVGVGITQLFKLSNSTDEGIVKLSHLGKPLGGSFICLGIMMLWLGTSRYFHSQTVLSYGQFPASRGSVILATVSIMSVLLACFILIIVLGDS